MFEFTNKAPKPVVIWKELKKQSIPSGSLSHDYVRLMLWITLCASPDFKKSKESANKVLDGSITHDGLKQGFKQALSSMTESPPVRGNIPHTITDWDNYPKSTKNYLPGTDEDLTGPILMFREVFINHEVEPIIALANRIFPLTPEAEEILKASMDVYNISLLRFHINPVRYFNTEVFTSVFKPAALGTERPTMDKADMVADIEDLLEETLAKSSNHALNGNKVELPRFTHIMKDRGENCEA